MKIIGITGGKGGTGKSTVATALAYELSKNNKVLLVDADVDCPNDHLILNISREKLKIVYQRIPEFDLDKCSKCGLCGKVCKVNSIISIKGNYPIFIPEQCNGCGSCEIVCPVGAISWKNKEIGTIYTGKLSDINGKSINLNLLSGDLKANQPTSEFIVNSLNEEIEKQKDEYDYIIIDTAAGTHCPVIAAFEMCDLIFAVTEPTPLGAHDLEIILKVLSQINKEGQIIINKADIGDPNIIQNIALKHNTQILFKIPYSREIVNAYSNSGPINIQNINVIIKEIDRLLKN